MTKLSKPFSFHLCTAFLVTFTFNDTYTYSTLSGGGKGETALTSEGKGDVLNIFSLASGHLYERLMRIMMLSVLRQTEARVKFWILKNYLSPHFKVC